MTTVFTWMTTHWILTILSLGGFAFLALLCSCLKDDGSEGHQRCNC